MARTPKSNEPRRRENPDKSFPNLKFSPFKAKTESQRRYFNALDSFNIVFGVGPAGTGKTACSVSYACQELYFGRIERIIITRPLVSACNEEIGFLPGTVDDKQSPFLVPVRAIMDKVLGKHTVEMFIKSGHIEGVPLAFCRGRTFDNSHIIVDEAQNTSPEQMLMILTRCGESSKVFINGDEEQSDQQGLNGLSDAMNRIRWMPECKIVEFGLDDIVRNGMLSDIIQSYRKSM